MNPDFPLLHQCYCSGQISESQWQEHLEDPKFKEWVETMNDEERNHHYQLVEENKRLRGLLWYAWNEFNLVAARSGVPLTHDGMPTCTEEFWSEMTNAFRQAIGDENAKPWPSEDAENVRFPPALAQHKGGE